MLPIQLPNSGLSVFESPAEIRLIVRSLLAKPCKKIVRIGMIEATAQVEHEPSFTRMVGYEKLRLPLVPRR